MGVYQPLIYKIATQQWEFDLVHRLNYRTFVEEIPQHPRNHSRRLIDKFHAQNTYIICLSGTQLVGMVALRGERPFSLDQKLSNLDQHLPPERKLCEVRLLSVDSKFRKTSVFLGLILRLVEVAKARGYDMALISGTTRQIKLYQHLGFAPFGPVVGNGEALYQPMSLSLEGFEEQVKSVLGRATRETREAHFLPGPVAVREQVARAFSQAPISHRAPVFLEALAITKDALRRLCGAKHVALALGSGTLANDMVAAQLSLRNERGLVLSNGEFGERLVDHANRWDLRFEVHRRDWGVAFDYAALETLLREHPEVRWIWAVHCETSTGMLNDLQAMRGLAQRNELKLCLDAISTVGALPMDLEGVYLATSVSGKGLGAYPGIGMVFAHEALAPSDRLPRYLDSAAYLRDDAVPFTHSSNLMFALRAALEQQHAARYAAIARAGKLLRDALNDAGLRIVCPAAFSTPAVTTIALPHNVRSREVGEALQQQGFFVAYASDYLLARNWVQICLFGEFAEQSLYDVVDALAHAAQVHQTSASLAVV